MGCGQSKTEPQQQASKPQKAPEEKPKPTEQPKSSEEPKPEAPAAPEPAAEPEPAPESGGEFTDFHTKALAKHNEYRALHNAPAMTLNKGLCDLAQGWAEQLAAKQAFEHSKDRNFEGQACGENLYMGVSSAPNVDGDAATQSWYDEIKDYSWDNPGFAMNTGHFTQVVWKGSTELGMGCATYQKDGWYHMVVVANYLPAGNMMGAFEENVLERTG